METFVADFLIPTEKMNTPGYVGPRNFEALCLYGFLEAKSRRWTGDSINRIHLLVTFAAADATAAQQEAQKVHTDLVHDFGPLEPVQVLPA